MRGIQMFCQENWPARNPAFDGSKGLYCCGEKLLRGEMTRDVTVQNFERFDAAGRPLTEKLRIKVQEVGTVSLAGIGQSLQKVPQESIQAIDIILRHCGMTKFVQVGRSFFYKPIEVQSLGGCMDLWHGIFQSAMFGTGNKLFLNVDVAHKGFPRDQTVRDLVADLGTKPLIRDRPAPPHFNPENQYKFGVNTDLDDKIRNYLKGLKIKYEIPNDKTSRRVYRVNDLVESPPNKIFVLDGQGEISVYDYYAKMKNYKIRFPDWPCLHAGPRDKTIFLPMELCKVAPNQVTVKKLNEEQTRMMVSKAVTKPDVRKKNIFKALGNLGLNNDRCLGEFNISVGTQMTQVRGRVLPPPSLAYRSDQDIKVMNGAWRIDRVRFLTTGRAVESWDFIIVCDSKSTSDRDLNTFKNHMVSVGNNLGMPFSRESRDMWTAVPNLKLLAQFLESQARYLRGGPLDIVFVVLPKSFDGLNAYREHLIHGSFYYSTITNILLKVNAKLNGKNHRIHMSCRPSCFNENVMIMGADVTHPPPDSQSCPSFAAVTASHDREDLFKFNMQCRLQPPKVEEIQDLENITLEHLRYFADKNSGKYPSRIIFYRDGVSDGQFDMVLSSELVAMKKAFRTIGESYKPKITLLVVQKRHHTRFFPNQGDGDRNGNVPAGFVVDNTITHPTDMDFYLVSHQSIQGTSRPTKYKVLYDDPKMTEDELEKLTFFLCHLYARCNRSISYPAPTYYAHHAATRAKLYFNEGKSTIDVNDEAALRHENMKVGHAMENMMKSHPMFFV
ncbi:protein argonaute-2-like [Cloeon dipterum]|uniref:protein argonaute-2-like n=1 Tax=Cloeon dipterum TaxID=197152 RepID=UPI00321F6284